MEIDNRIKANFFQQYQDSHQCFEGISNSLWRVECCLVFGYSVYNGDYGKIKIKDTSLLVLKSLDTISDEDAYEMALFNRDLGDNTNFNELVQHSKSTIMYDEILKCLRPHHIDFLRSKGYAVPYLNLSVLKLIELGWIIIKN